VGCAYTEAANGAGMQTFAADGFAIAMFNCARACYDPSFGSPLYGAHILNHIHDELIFEWEYDGDEERSHARAQEACDLMVESMRQVVPDVKVSVAAVLMRRWHKAAKEVHDERGLLKPWEPKT
jgi:DNA polymerase I-like protein with 3'-5' exonuclease and polymerase domains